MMLDRCGEVAGKLVGGVFGWRHKYDVQRLHRANHLLHSNSAAAVAAGSASNAATAASTTCERGGSVVVHSLQSADGGILDPDDRLQDVADDREQLVAAFEDDDLEEGAPAVASVGGVVVGGRGESGHHQHAAGDGASNSSRDTPSPEPPPTSRHAHYPATNRVQVGEGVEGGHHNHKTGAAIEVTLGDLDQLTHGTALQVRRGSEPALNHLQDSTTVGNGGRAGNSNAKRWSAAPVITESKYNNLHKEDRALSNGHSTDKWREAMDEEEEDDEEEEEELLGGRVAVIGGGGVGGGSRRRNGWLKSGGGATPFTRDGSNRLSMQFLGDSPTGMRWADAADKASSRGGAVHSLSLPREVRMRKEPLGQATPNDNDNTEMTELICLATDSGALGIHVVPEYDWRGGERGLVVQAVEEGGRVHRDGRLRTGDRITNINGRSLIGQPFHVVQDIFRDSLRSSELRLRVVKQQPMGKTGGGVKKPPPPPVYPKPPPPGSANKENQSGIGRFSTNSNGPEGGSSKDNHLQQQQQQQQQLQDHQDQQQQRVGVGVRKSYPGVGGLGVGGLGGAVGALQTGNTRRIGRKMEVQLVKGQHGLGFSITTRDNPAGGNCPIYIKNILPKGAAIEDGRLRPGDRLLAVDGVELTGKTQAEAVALLRQVPANQSCVISVSRHDVTTAPVTTQTTDGGTSMEVTSSSLSPGKQRPADAKSVKSLNNSSNQDSNSSAGSSSSKRASANSDSNNYTSNQGSGKDDQLTGDSAHAWRQREIVTLYIPVHDTEKAGLGVSVKGKTTSAGGVANSSTTDLGIFIKNVLHGGAASRDGRLRTNDQLLSVNGISLSGLSNQAAMETLRRAMLRTEGPVEGTIVLTVARRIGGGGGGSGGDSSGHHHRRGSESSLLTDSSANTETFGSGGGSGFNGAGGVGDQQNNSGNSEASDSTVICLPPPSSTNHNHHHHQSSLSSNSSNTTNQRGPTNNSGTDGVLMRNAVLERLTGQTSLPGMGNLHNESYYRATHQTTLVSLGAGGVEGSKLTSPTVNEPGRETLIIEDDTSFLPSGSPAAGMPVGGGVKAARTDSSTSSQADATYASQLSLLLDGASSSAAAAGFARDAFGRQSMSEKRHATLDAKNTDTYRRTKKARELRQVAGGAVTSAGALGMARVNSAESLARSETEGDLDKTQLGPSLGMKKSSSLESLQTMVQEMQMYEDHRSSSGMAAGGASGGAAVRVIRGRGCNESFRAAVDRSYDAPLHQGGAGAPMDTLTEDGDLGGGPGPGVGGLPLLGRRQTSLDSKLKAKKRQSLLRGIGSMFRFGKHRKSADGGEMEEMDDGLMMGVGGAGGGGGGGASLGAEPNVDAAVEGVLEGEERKMARKLACEEQQRIHEQLRRLMVAAASTTTQTSGSRESGVDVGSNGGGGSRTMTSSASGSDVTNAGSGGGGPVTSSTRTSGSAGGASRTMTSSASGSDVTTGGPVTSSSSSSRTERIHQLRAHHQLRHQERRGHYPLDDTEERYEMALRQRLEQSPELDNAIHRPGSRVGITDSARFSHYVNYQQIQHHLNMRNEQHPNHQQHPHKQQQHHKYVEVRCPPLTPSHYSSTLSVRVINDDNDGDDENSRRQQHYHSQRREPSGGASSHGGHPHHHQHSVGGHFVGGAPPRPVSNYYEYESVETHLLSGRTDGGSNSLPRRPVAAGGAPQGPLPPQHHPVAARHAENTYSAVPGLAHHFRPPPQMMSNNNNINHNNNNNINSNHNNNNNNNVRKSHGPFVSHVTIRECQQQQKQQQYQPKV